MAETKDPAIKLFGKTIPLQEIPLKSPKNWSRKTEVHPHDVDNDDDDEGDDDEIDTKDMDENSIPGDREIDKIDQDGKTFQTEQVRVSPEVSNKSTCQAVSLVCTNNLEALSGAKEKASGESFAPEEEKAEMSSSQDTNPKKPDKILPCPRCNSMDTKFCYYNNYNVNQPRHFCKNCQRYWTAGGTMRNVPVGAGRRRNKNSVSHYRQVTIPEALHNTQPDIPNAFHPALPTNGTVLSFSSDVPLCESMASILNLAERTEKNCSRNGFQKPEELKIPNRFVGLEHGGNDFDGSNSNDYASKSALNESAAPYSLPFPQIPCYLGAPWPCPWNSTQWSSPIAAPPFCPNGFAIPFYHAPPYWGYNVPGTWNIPLMAQLSHVSHSNSSSGPNSPLGKHSRDGTMLSPTNSEEKEMEGTGSERSIWIPKTLRIDDPGELAKSSIWTTLGKKNTEKPVTIGRGTGLFKAFQSKHDGNDPHLETSAVLQANPAALSRTQNFQENSR